MKKTFYLFNPGILERKDNTLKFTPCTEEDEGMAVAAHQYIDFDLQFNKHAFNRTLWN